MTIDEAQELAGKARAAAFAALEASDETLREVYRMAQRRATIAEHRLRLVEQENNKLKTQLDEAWEAVAKVTDANP